MSEFISVMDAMNSASYNDQKMIRDEVADIEFRLRRTMDEGLSIDEMKLAQAAKQAVDAANEILAKVFQ
ncbi:MAG: hypothetical protein IIV95_06630 [Burkholderiaceae bacterium]|jgi:hypothetical protein|nr:hypothetical protein [Burkholderiaceae bacterium]